MASTPERRLISAWLDTTLNAASLLAGRLLAPEGGGWNTDPSSSGAEFTPYSVITPGTGIPVDPSFGDPSADWTLSYQISTYGVTDDQIEERADTVRNTLLAIKKEPVVMSDGTWKITTIKCPTIGGVGYTTAINPPAYSQTDSYTLHLSRSMA